MNEAEHAKMAGDGPQLLGRCGVFTALCILRIAHTLALQGRRTTKVLNLSPSALNVDRPSCGPVLL